MEIVLVCIPGKLGTSLNELIHNMQLNCESPQRQLHFWNKRYDRSLYRSIAIVNIYIYMLYLSLLLSNPHWLSHWLYWVQIVTNRVNLISREIGSFGANTNIHIYITPYQYTYLDIKTPEYKHHHIARTISPKIHYVFPNLVTEFNDNKSVGFFSCFFFSFSGSFQ